MSKKTVQRKTILVFVSLLVIHLIHIIEEVLGNAYFIESIYHGLTGFLIINTLFWIIPIILLIGIIKKMKMAYYFSIIYGLIMIIDGLDHIIKTYAGFYTGILLTIFGTVLIFYLFREVKNMKGGKR